MGRTENQRDWYADGLRFTCTQCGNCCTGPTGFVWFTDEELTAMAEYTGLTREQFMRRHARRIGRRMSLTERKTTHGYDCVFLHRDERGRALCTVYPVRPVQCRTWPFWPENLSSPEAYEHAGSNCPGMKAGLKGEGEFHSYQQITIRRDKTQ